MKITVEGLTYNVESSGIGPPLVLLHGFTGDITTWEDLKQRLIASHQVITIDIIGHGLTESPIEVSRYEIVSVAKDLCAILDHMHIDKAHFLGYSMGGRLALSFAVLYPKRMISLILESASPGLKTSEEKEKRIQSDDLLATRIIEKGVEDFVKYWEQIPLFSTQRKLAPLIQEQIRAQRLANNPHGLALSLRGMGTGNQPSWWDKLDRLQIPVLLVSGKLDEKFCAIAKEMQSQMKNAKLCVFQGAGHAIHVEEPAKFGTMVGEFLFTVSST